jgi:hypothetical protein
MHATKTATRFEVFKATKIQVAVFWVVTLCTDVAGFKRFGGPPCLHLQGEVKIESAMVLRNAGILTYHNTVSEPRRPRPEYKIAPSVRILFSITGRVFISC